MRKTKRNTLNSTKLSPPSKKGNVANDKKNGESSTSFSVNNHKESKGATNGTASCSSSNKTKHSKKLQKIGQVEQIQNEEPKDRKGDSSKKGKKVISVTNEKGNATSSKTARYEVQDDASMEEEDDASSQMDEITLCQELINQMEMQESCWPFLEAVNTRHFPTYKKIIKRPMDLSIIRSKLESNRLALTPNIVKFVNNYNFVYLLQLQHEGGLFCRHSTDVRQLRNLQRR